jgi:hypothetical protein
VQCFEHGGIDIANIPAFENRAVPGFVANHAFVNEPCIKLPTIGVEPDLVAALERSKASASATYYPGPRGELGNNGPADLKCIAHTVSVFRSEVHQDGGVRKPLRTRRGDVLARLKSRETAETQMAHPTMPDRSHATTR